MTKYVKKTHREHILDRPDSYIGSVASTSGKQWVVEDDGKFVFKNIDYSPGLVKIVDEILVNACDHNQVPGNTMSQIKVAITDNSVCVQNDGGGITTAMHDKEPIRIIQLIFGSLLTSSNYDDSEKKLGGGRNGYGSKLTNVYSLKFTCEVICKAENKKYTQTWTDNMTNVGDPKIVSSRAAGYVKITFEPDFKRFGMKKFTNDMKLLLHKRVYDAAGCNPDLKVYLNNKLIRINNFTSYCKLYTDQKLISMKSDLWEICVTTSSGEFQQTSFVNSVCTSDGGTHIDLLMNMIKSEINGKSGKYTLSQIKNHTWIFVKALVENPTFGSQVKSSLTTESKLFKNTISFPEAFKKNIRTSDIKKLAESYANVKVEKSLNKISGKKVKKLVINKLSDANNAGGSKSHLCTLILTEGDSAKTLAISGLSVVGRDNYGVFPLKGKLLNVRDATALKITSNEEISNIVKILGLRVGKKAKIEDMRYGKLLIMADQDHDGSHIKGLIINFIHKFWPELLEGNDFMEEFITPIIKATKGKISKSFFTMPEYLKWKKTNTKGWKIKYYKGLGTSTAKEAKEYFKNMDIHKLKFDHDSTTDDKIDLAFNKKRADERKDWISSIDKDEFIENIKSVTYTDFVNKELVLFSEADCIRSIPSVVDGFKPGQRKILFSCFKRNLKNEIKVAQLAGYVSENSAYHHGEVSLMGTIVAMAQDFVGSNNINFLHPGGQFGTRILGGKDSASPRYIFTRLTDDARKYFKEEDDGILEYLNDDGQSVEPIYYVPTIPMVLVNGAEGIGTGWSTGVPQFNPKDIIKCIKAKLNNKPMPKISPWYKGFNGKITPTKTGFQSHGIAIKENGKTRITELPIKKWTETFKNSLSDYDYVDHSGDTHVDFVINGDYPEPAFKLCGYGNMHLFDKNGKIKKYSSPHEIIDDFYEVRLEYYTKRKIHMIKSIKSDLLKLTNEERFILMVVDNKLQVMKKKKDILVKELEKLKFEKIPTYDYLINLPIRRLTHEEVELIKNKVLKMKELLSEIQATTESQMWLNDL